MQYSRVDKSLVQTSTLQYAKVQYCVEYRGCPGGLPISRCSAVIPQSTGTAEKMAVIKDTQKSADTALKRDGADLKRVVRTPL